MFSSLRTLVTLVVLVLVSATSVFAQQRKIEGSIEYNQTMQSSDDAHQLNAFTQISWDGKKIGVSTFALVTEGWGQFYVGPTYVVTDWLAVSGALGIESGHPSLRKAGSVWAGRGRFGFLTIQEKGSDHWQKNVAKFQVTRVFSAGLFQQTYFGTGPYVELTVGKTTVWGSYTPSDHRGIVGLKRSF